MEHEIIYHGQLSNSEHNDVIVDLVGSGYAPRQLLVGTHPTFGHDLVSMLILAKIGDDNTKLFVLRHRRITEIVLINIKTESKYH